MTSKPDQVAAAVLEDMGRGVTYFAGRGGYTGQERDILLCVVGISEVSRLRELVHRLDPRAFVIVTDAHEVVGEGFTR